MNGWIRVTQDLSTLDEISIGHLVGNTYYGRWNPKEKGYMVTYNGSEWYLVKQDECESAECAFCLERAMDNANVCVNCLNAGLERTLCCEAPYYETTIQEFAPVERTYTALCCEKCHDIKEEIA
jgi:hypothetical protein